MLESRPTEPGGPGVDRDSRGRRGQLIGLDQIADLITEARRRAKGMSHAEFVVHNANKPLPLASDWANLGVCCYAIYYLNDIGAVLDEVKRVLVPDGRFFVLGPARNNNHEMRDLHTRLSGVEEPATITLYRHRIEDEVVPLCRERWSKVSVVPFYNEVRFTSSSAYGAYYRASPLLARATNDAVAREQLAQRVEAAVAAQIKAEGAFVIHKEAVGILAGP